MKYSKVHERVLTEYQKYRKPEQEEDPLNIVHVCKIKKQHFSEEDDHKCTKYDRVHEQRNDQHEIIPAPGVTNAAIGSFTTDTIPHVGPHHMIVASQGIMAVHIMKKLTMIGVSYIKKTEVDKARDTRISRHHQDTPKLLQSLLTLRQSSGTAQVTLLS